MFAYGIFAAGEICGIWECLDIKSTVMTAHVFATKV